VIEVQNMLIDLDEEDDFVVALANEALASPAAAAELRELAAAARHLLDELEQLGLVRLERRADGSIAAVELLDRVVH
jgi:hypothetical protein